MKLRWSDGRSHAVEFEAFSAEELPEAMTNALITYRAKHGAARVELHVEAAPAHWNDPYLRLHDPEPTATPEIVISGYYYVHVINRPGHPAAVDGRPYLEPSGCDYVLWVGPDGWHAPTLWAGVMAAVGRMNALNGFIGDVMDGVREHFNREDNPQ